jgi:hypothetical protein
VRRGGHAADDVGRERPETRQRGRLEAELAIGDILEDHETFPARPLHESAAPVTGQAHAGRVVVIRDRVEDLRPLAVERIDDQAVGVRQHRLEAGLEAAERNVGAPPGHSCRRADRRPIGSLLGRALMARGARC